MATEPVEIKLTLDTSGVKRDLERMKKDMQAANPSKPSGGFQAQIQRDQPPSGGSLFGNSPGLNRSAFPSSGGGGVDADLLPGASQKEIGKLIGGTAKKAVTKEIEGIDWGKLLKGYLRGGTGGAMDAAGGLRGLLGGAGDAAGAGEAGAAAGAGEAGAAAGALGAAATGVGIVALAVILAPIVAGKIADDAEHMSTITAGLKEIIPGFDTIDKMVEWFRQNTAALEAVVKSHYQALGETASLEKARLRLGQNVDMGQIGSDYSKLQKLDEFDIEKKRAIDARNARTNSSNIVKEGLKQIEKAFTAGIGK